MSEADACLFDSPTIDRTIDNGQLRGDVVISEDTGNQLVENTDGLYSRSGQNDCARIFNSGAVAVAAPNLVTIPLASTRFAAPAGMVSGGAIRILRTGIYHVGCCVAWAAGIATDNFRVVLLTAQGSPPQTYPDCHSGYNNTFSAAGFTSAKANFGFQGLVWLPKGATLGLQAQHDAAGSGNVSALEEDGLELFANLVLDLS